MIKQFVVTVTAAREFIALNDGARKISQGKAVAHNACLQEATRIATNEALAQMNAHRMGEVVWMFTQAPVIEVART